MTDDPRPDDAHLDDRHLDDTALSTVLDGEATVEESLHADLCDRCRTRMSALRDASVLVGMPVPPPDPARRDAAIAAALAVADAPANVVPLRRRTPPPWLAAAAVIIAAVVGIALVLPNSTGGDDDDTAASGAADDSAAEESMAQGDAFELAVDPVDGGDLGVVDPASLRTRVEGDLTAQRSAADVAAPEASGGSDGTTSDEDSAAATTMATAVVPCEPELRESYPDLGPLVYRATGTFEGEDVAIVGFDVGPDRWLYVVTVDGCIVRNQQTYAP